MNGFFPRDFISDSVYYNSVAADCWPKKSFLYENVFGKCLNWRSIGSFACRWRNIINWNVASYLSRIQSHLSKTFWSLHLPLPNHLNSFDLKLPSKGQFAVITPSYYPPHHSVIVNQIHHYTSLNFQVHCPCNEGVDKTFPWQHRQPSFQIV